jgi:23S rRNA pseudouridine2605 synthase
MERLHKYMARCGVASRRKCEQMIIAGIVSVNGISITSPGYCIEPGKDRVKVAGRVISDTKQKVYIMLNKPLGYVSTARDQFNRPTVIDLVKGVGQRIYPVGRLDYDSQGLILLTNDGDFAHRMMHPSHQVNKEYLALVNGYVSRETVEKLRNGVEIDGKATDTAIVNVAWRKSGKTLLRLIIHEGRNRQVRKMCGAVGHPVEMLKRVAIGDLRLGNLPEGKWRYLTRQEVYGLLNQGRPSKQAGK